MKPSRLSHPARLGVVLVLMVVWLVATNHCGLGLMTRAESGGGMHAHCHGGTVPEKAPAKEGNECCRSIQGTLAMEKVEAKFDLTDFQLVVLASLTVRLPSSAEPAGIKLGAGPPGRSWFAETVLPRSVQSHAPPMAV